MIYLGHTLQEENDEMTKIHGTCFVEDGGELEPHWIWSDVDGTSLEVFNSSYLPSCGE